MTTDERRRFLALVAVNPLPDACWLWLGSTDKDGYGLFELGGKTQRAHKVAWEDRNGPLPEGKVLLHSCDVRNCVRAKHLTADTQQANVADAIKKGRQRQSMQRSKV